jgi:hypothetical protein
MAQPRGYFIFLKPCERAPILEKYFFQRRLDFLLARMAQFSDRAEEVRNVRVARLVLFGFI